MRVHSAILAAGITAMTAAGLQAACPQQQQQQDSAPFVPIITSQISVALPAPISPDDAERWIRYLGLSQERADRLRSIVAAFAPDAASEYRAILAKANELAQSVGSSHTLYEMPEKVEVFRQLLRERPKALARLESIDERLFLALAAELDEAEESDAADAIRQIRRRTRLLSYPSRMPVTDLNLREIRLRLEAAGELEVIDEEDAWEAAWRSHDHELASLHERRVARQLREGLEDAETFYELGRSYEALADARTAVMNQNLRVERSIIAANQRWTESFGGMLGPDSAARFRDAVEGALYPSLYPRSIDLRPVLLALEEEDNPTDPGELREQIQFEVVRLRERETRLERAIIDLEVLESRSMVTPSAREALKRDIEDLNRERCRAGKRVLEATASIPALDDNEAVAALRRACSKCAAEGDPDSK